MAVAFTGAAQESSKAYRIVGEYIASETESEEGQDATAATKADSLDLSTAAIRVTYEVPSVNGETETVELASDRLVDGRVVFEGEIEEPTDVRISIVELEDQWKWVYATITPGGGDIVFALVDDGDVRLATTSSLFRVIFAQLAKTCPKLMYSFEKLEAMPAPREQSILEI